ncbi:Rz1-like lysis system protein LysC [Ancylobacter polymorphus]|uniref:Rz1-like lysis system protein LysC n=1 Tax=Ancylobacter polymorphus TaxID=223390 RepID=UPI003F9BC029
MKPTKIVIATALASGLTACSGSTASVRPSLRPTLEPAPAALRQPCAAPVVIPPGGKTQGQTERSWAKDRVALVECGADKAALVEFYDKRDAALAAPGGEP